MGVRIPYSWCLTNTCVAGNLIAPRLLHAMETGRKLTLEVVDSNLLTVPTTVSLEQFAAAHKGPPAKNLRDPGRRGMNAPPNQVIPIPPTGKRTDIYIGQREYFSAMSGISGTSRISVLSLTTL